MTRTEARRRVADDQGMTLAEVVVASLILMLIATGLLTLFITSVNATALANQKAVATQFIDSYMDDVRRMDYASVGTVSGNPAGGLSAVTADVSGLSLVATPTVTWVDDPLISGTQDYKKVAIAISVLSGGTVKYQTSSSTYVRRPDMNSGASNENVPPNIEFLSGSPADGSIVYGTSVTVGARAWTTMSGVTLIRLAYYANAPTLANLIGEQADWAISTQSIEKSFAWDTMHIDEDGVRSFPDGTRDLKVQVADSIGQIAYRRVNVIVDNFAPSTPGTVTLSPATGGPGIASSWGTTYDGTDIANGYRVEYVRENKTDANWTYGAAWADTDATTTTHTNSAAGPFTRWWVRVWAKSPRDIFSNYGSSGNVATVSRPALAGTYSLSSSGSGANKIYTTSVSLVAPTAPQFTVSGTVTYDLFRSNDPANMGTVPWKTATTPTAYTDTIATAKKGLPKNWVYQYRVTFKPAGWPSFASNPTQQVWSNQVQTGTETTVGGPWALPQNW